MTLRDPDDADAAPLAAAYVEDPTLGAMIGFETDPTAEEILSWAAGEGERRAAGTGVAMTITAVADAAPLGHVNIHKLDWRHRRGELGIWLVTAARGRGAGREALDLMCAWAFGELDLHRMQLTTISENEPMRRLAERAGFLLEGTLRDYTFERGRYHDNLMYARIAP